MPCVLASFRGTRHLLPKGRRDHQNLSGAMEPLRLSDGVVEAVVVPALGAGLASFDFVAGGRREPLFRPCRSPDRASPFDLALNLLVPWSGRISGGGFTFDGRFHPLAANLPGEALPIHGNGFAVPWTVAEAGPTRAVLTLRSQGPGPYDYEAQVTYTLAQGGLAIGLTVCHQASEPLPYGLGLHPWFPRTSGTRLKASATAVTLEDSRHLPAGQIAVANRPDWDFDRPRKLPGAWINNDFSPWDGQAEIRWDDRGLALDIASADPHLAAYILYSPASDADFFCFEPVTHPVDAHNRPGGPERHGLKVLRKTERLRIQCMFTPRLL